MTRGDAGPGGSAASRALFNPGTGRPRIGGGSIGRIAEPAAWGARVNPIVHRGGDSEGSGQTRPSHLECARGRQGPWRMVGVDGTGSGEDRTTVCNSVHSVRGNALEAASPRRNPGRARQPVPESARPEADRVTPSVLLTLLGAHQPNPVIRNCFESHYRHQIRRHSANTCSRVASLLSSRSLFAIRSPPRPSLENPQCRIPRISSGRAQFGHWRGRPPFA